MTYKPPIQPSTRDYINKIRAIPLLEKEEEYTLAKKWQDQQDKKAMDRLVNSHLKLVAKIARGYQGYGLPMADLIAEGNIGMLQAVKHFDPEKGFRFSTYAMWWVRANIQDYVLKSWSLVKMGTTSAQKKLFFGLKRAKEKVMEGSLNEKSMTHDKATKIAVDLKVKPEEVIQMNRRLGGKDHSLNAPLKAHSAEGETTEWIDWIRDDKDNQEIQLVQNNEMTNRRKLLSKAIECLTPREHIILMARRMEEKPKTLENLSVELSISRERVRQIEVKAMDKLQHEIKKLTTPTYRHM